MKTGQSEWRCKGVGSYSWKSAPPTQDVMKQLEFLITNRKMWKWIKTNKITRCEVRVHATIQTIQYKRQVSSEKVAFFGGDRGVNNYRLKLESSQILKI